ncbi:MAG: UDP-glucose 4-epimerase [Microgenomates group bacterium Gr01-1014_5]|nr:MAG: UDP-glucose 4-epimerase [Microgenomates group bacterium Gr01-1014_5]
MKKIAITGASGFIGQNVARNISQESDVELKLLDRKKHDLLDSESLKDFVENQDMIIHLAGVNRGTYQELFQTNVLGTLSLLDAVVKHAPGARIIFASTFQVYLPHSLYGLSKKFAEELLTLYGVKNKIQSTVLRLANVYGPGGKPFYNSVIATFAHQIKLGETLQINGDGSQERDYIYVTDAADAFIKAALYKQEELSEIIDICSGEHTSLKKILKTIEGVSDKKINVVYNNEAVPETPWPTRDKTYSMAKELLGWEPKTTLGQGLTEVMK